MKPTAYAAFFFFVIVAVSGCASIDRAGSKMDAAAGRISEPGPLEHEGLLLSAKKIGVMTSIQFQDGAMYDVNDVSPALQAGDTVRVYKTEKGLEARLWKAAPEMVPAHLSTKQ